MSKSNESLPESSGPLLSVIVPVYDRNGHNMRTTQRCLGALMETCDPNLTEIIVTDDASPEWNLQEWCPPSMKVNRNPQNLGFGANCNKGAMLSTAPILLFLNSDTVTLTGWMKALIQAYQRHPTAILGPRLLYPTNSPEETPRIQSVGGLYDVAKKPFHRFFGYRADYPLAQVEEQVKWTTGAALALPRDLWEALDGFDEAYQRAYFEDVDLCERAKQLGAEIWYVPDSVIVHKTAQTTATPTFNPVQDFLSARQFQHNRWLFHSRWDEHIVPDVGSVLQPHL